MVRADDLADVLAKRHDFLEELADRPRTKPGLVEATGTSRSTVDRAIDALEDQGLVRRRDGGYRLTFTGRRALTAFEDYRTRLDALDAARDVLGSLPADAAVDPDALVGATVRESPRYPNDVGFQDVPDLLERGDRLRVVGPALPPRYVEDVRRAVVENDLAVEFVVTPTVVEMVDRMPCDDLLAVVDDDRVTFYRLDDAVPFALWIVAAADGTTSGIVAYSDTGVTGVVRNDTDAMTEWATGTFEDYRDRATEGDPFSGA